MNHLRVFFLIVIILHVTACQSTPACPSVTGTPHYLTLSELEALPSTPDPFPNPTEVEINGKLMTVDKMVSGPLCNDHWKGTVYVACDVRVFEWKEDPLFLKDCNLSIEPGTVVYVADHNDAPYYNGCSCHTGVNPEN